MRDSFKIAGGMRDEKQKIITLRTLCRELLLESRGGVEINILSGAGSRDVALFDINIMNMKVA